MRARQFQAIRRYGSTVIVDYINREISYVLYADGFSMCYDFKHLDFDAYVAEIKKCSMYVQGRHVDVSDFVIWTSQVINIFGEDVAFYVGRNKESRGDYSWWE